MRRRVAHHPVAVSEAAIARNAERNRSMNLTMTTRGDTWTIQGSTTTSRRHALQGLGVLTLAVLSLSSRRSSAAAQESTPAATPGADWAATFATPGQTATINGAAIYYEVRGPTDGPPVLLMPGDL